MQTKLPGLERIGMKSSFSQISGRVRSHTSLHLRVRVQDSQNNGCPVAESTKYVESTLYSFGLLCGWALMGHFVVLRTVVAIKAASPTPIGG